MKQILLLLLKGAELWEISAFTDVFGWNQLCGGKRMPIGDSRSRGGGPT